MRKNGFKKDFTALPDVNFFMFVLLIINYTVFLVQFGIDLHLRVFKTISIYIRTDAFNHMC